MSLKQISACEQTAEALESRTKQFEELEFCQLEEESGLEEKKEARCSQLLQERAEFHCSVARRKVGAVRRGEAHPSAFLSSWTSLLTGEDGCSWSSGEAAGDTGVWRLGENGKRQDGSATAVTQGGGLVTYTLLWQSFAEVYTLMHGKFPNSTEIKPDKLHFLQKHN